MPRRALLVALLLSCCNRDAPTTTPEPTPTEGEPDVDGFEFVGSDQEDREYEDYVDEEDAGEGGLDKDKFAVTTVEQAREVAEAAVSDQLNRKKQWKTSPVLPAEWPSKGPRVMFLFYPMALHPGSMETYELFSPEWAVIVSLEDGETEVEPVKGSRRLGTIEDTRASGLEKRELAMAEEALLVHLAGGEATSGENQFWGYLKYFHEHPKIGSDIKKRRPTFVKWLEGRPHHT